VIDEFVFSPPDDDGDAIEFDDDLSAWGDDGDEYWLVEESEDETNRILADIDAGTVRDPRQMRLDVLYLERATKRIEDEVRPIREANAKAEAKASMRALADRLTPVMSAFALNESPRLVALEFAHAHPNWEIRTGSGNHIANWLRKNKWLA
jgi:hypothetical protein